MNEKPAVEWALSDSTPHEIHPVEVVTPAPSWMDPIWDYLSNGRLPSDQNEARKLRSRASKFVIHENVLSKRGPIVKMCHPKRTTSRNP